MGGQQPTHRHTEPADKVGGLLVAVGLGQSGEAREVRKQKRLHRQLRTLRHRSPEPTSNHPARRARLLLVRAGSAAGAQYTSLRLPNPTWGTGRGMRIIKLAWVGTRTDSAEPTVAFFREVLGLRLELDRPGFWMLKLPDGGKVEVVGSDSPINRHFTTGPVAGFLVDDIHDAPPSCDPPASRSSLSQRS